MSRRFSFSRMAALVVAAILILAPSGSSPAYSVLTHEQIVDFLWDSDIQRILKQHYPSATDQDLKAAHAFAYGGSLIQDMGYYPHGNKLFSDLVHYVRSGDFVTEMMRDSENVNELAFALGALAHYTSDTTGHPAVNEAVSLTFPKLRAKYGHDVTYAENPKAHIRTEFGFDVTQVAQGHYTSQSYHDFIGFQVSRPLLDRAFLRTYGIPVSAVLPDEDMAIESFRHTLSVWMPRLTQVALITKKKELKAVPNFDPKRFRYILRRADYEREWGTRYQKPGFGERFLAFLVRILPKVGPLATLDIKTPTKETEKIYVKSVEQTVAAYHDALARTDDPAPPLADRNLDTGHPTSPAEYTLTDKAYAELLKRLAHDNYTQVTPELRANILEFYQDTSRPIETKRHKEDWNEVLRDVEALKRQTVSRVEPGP